MKILKTPFKFLDSYQKEDYDIFFGREKEIEGLYHALSGVKHLLVYGPSGAGKTSLVECGLRNQFSDADWFALTIRRREGEDMMASFYACINGHLSEQIPLAEDTSLPIEAGVGFGHAIERLFEERYQPVYLLFDQFEELLIQGETKEKTDFFTGLNELIRYKVPCRVILIMREEFIGYLSEYEYLCPSIFQHRFRLEKMNKSHVRGMLVDTLTAPSLQGYFSTTDPGALADGILSRIPDDKFEIELAHVQVFLTELWQRALALAEEGALPRLHLGLVRPEDQLEGILDNFLKDQLRDLLPVYGEKAPLEVLVAMISERYTKLQVSLEGLASKLEQDNVLVPSPLGHLIEELVERKILRATRSGKKVEYEISHDVLAYVVGRNQTEEMKLREEAGKIFSVYEGYSGLFSQEIIDHMRPYQRYKSVPLSLNRRIEESEAYLHATAIRWQQEKDEELENQKAMRREAETQKELAERAKRRATRFALFAAAFFMLGTAAVVFAYYNWDLGKKMSRIVEEKTEEAGGRAVREQIALKEAKIAEEKAHVAQEGLVNLSLQEADELIKSLDYSAALEKIYSVAPPEPSKNIAYTLMEIAFWYAEIGELLHAWGILDTAYQMAGQKLNIPLSKDITSLRDAIVALDPEQNTYLKRRYFPKMKDIKGGEFTMGSDNGEDYEKPSHRVRVSDFQMSETEITWWQYGLFAAAQNIESSKEKIVGDNPVTGISWYDAISYTNWLNNRMDLKKAYQEKGERISWSGPGNPGYRLPTEAEWEFAAGGSKQQKYAGTDSEEKLGDYAWFNENSGYRTRPVRMKKANLFGLYDMSGNVWEWCWDWYDSYTIPVEFNPKGPDTGSYRVTRGGAWNGYSLNCSTSYRNVHTPGYRSNHTGFRLAKSL